MAVFKVNHSTEYTVVSNKLLRDNNLSLKTIGLLCKIMSLPADWDFSAEGLAAISKDGITSVNSALHEMEEFGYLVRKPLRDDKSRIIDWEYSFYEEPELGNLELENLILGNPGQ